MQCVGGAGGVAAIRDHKYPQRDPPTQPRELAATHSQPEMYSDFLVTIYSPNWWVLSFMPSEYTDMNFS